MSIPSFPVQFSSRDAQRPGPVARKHNSGLLGLHAARKLWLSSARDTLLGEGSDACHPQRWDGTRR